jgi:phage portal protein BeeE
MGIFKPRDKPKDALGGSQYSFFFGGTTAGKLVNEHTVMQITAVYSYVRILAETVAGLLLHVYRYTTAVVKRNIYNTRYINSPL